MVKKGQTGTSPRHIRMRRRKIRLPYKVQTSLGARPKEKGHASSGVRPPPTSETGYKSGKHRQGRHHGPASTMMQHCATDATAVELHCETSTRKKSRGETTDMHAWSQVPTPGQEQSPTMLERGLSEQRQLRQRLLTAIPTPTPTTTDATNDGNAQKLM